MSAKILILFGLISIGALASGTPVSQAQPSNRGLFAADLFKQISKDKLNENVLISPISIQAAMAMVFLGSKGETATELQNGLRLSSDNKDVVGQEFLDLLKETKGEAQLNVANKIYVRSNRKLRSTYNDLLSKYFNSEAESVDFRQNVAVAENVNNWIAKATNDKIQNALDASSLNEYTAALIVNAIYFKGKWKYPFSLDATRNKPFWISKSLSVNKEIMSVTDYFLYGRFPELGATGIEMPYKDSDLSMLILLPNERDGLGELEEKLESVALNELSSQMKMNKVAVELPKFKIEFSTNVKEVLKSLGMKIAFTDMANLSGMFEAGPPVKVTDVYHKALIDVNEAGCEAAAATIAKIEDRRGPRYFVANHPFVFAIKSADTVYFVGHIAKP